MTTVVVEKRGSAEWHVRLIPEQGTHDSLFRKFPTKRSALAAKRILDARSINEADALIVIEADAKRAQSLRKYQLTPAAARYEAAQFFAVLFGFNTGLPFPGGKAFLARFDTPA